MIHLDQILLLSIFYLQTDIKTKQIEVKFSSEINQKNTFLIIFIFSVTHLKHAIRFLQQNMQKILKIRKYWTSLLFQ